MWDVLILVVCLSPIWGALVFEVWDGIIRPRLISRREIDRLCRELTERYGTDAYAHARINEDRAWRYCDSYEQGRWRRVAETLEPPN